MGARPVKGLLLIGLAGVALAVVAKNASAAPVSNDRVPDGWTPPPGAVTVDVPGSSNLGFPVRGASWHANGQDVVLWWDPTDPRTFMAAQTVRAANGNLIATILAMGSTENSKALAAGLVGLS